jgi:hypothetical protein
MKRPLLILTLSLLPMTQAFAEAIINLDVDKGTYLELDDAEGTNILLRDGSKILSLRDGTYVLKRYDSKSKNFLCEMKFSLINGHIKGKKILKIEGCTIYSAPQ